MSDDRIETGQRSHKGPALLSKLLGRDGRSREERARLRAQVERAEE
jgi:hypothetical protein